MKTKSIAICALAAALLSAAPAAAKNDVKSADPGVRSHQSLPPASGKYHRPSSAQVDFMASAAADPPYCSGNKFGIYRGKGQKNGNGKALTCPGSPG